MSSECPECYWMLSQHDPSCSRARRYQRRQSNNRLPHPDASLTKIFASLGYTWNPDLAYEIGGQPITGAFVCTLTGESLENEINKLAKLGMVLNEDGRIIKQDPVRKLAIR